MAHCEWYIHSPIGPLRLEETDGFVTGLWFCAGQPTPPPTDCPSPLLAEAARQLQEYFAGRRAEFELPLRADGTDFQKAVWAVMDQIPYGQTRTYGQLAAALGKPGAARAVGGACHNNPIGIFQPCHRVVGANGHLTGFAGGLEVKQQLLALESKHTR